MRKMIGPRVITKMAHCGEALLAEGTEIWSVGVRVSGDITSGKSDWQRNGLKRCAHEKVETNPKIVLLVLSGREAKGRENVMSSLIVSGIKVVCESKEM